MHVARILTRTFRRLHVPMHAARCQSLCDAATTAARYQQLSLTALGRASERAITPKAAIKRIDRLLGNNLLHRERLLVYRALAQTVLREHRQPVLVLDWTAVSPGGHWYALRAAQISQGRTLTVFDAVYPQAVMERATTIAELLRQLAQVLPAGCTPLLILDAGFRSHWFAAITARGWHWLARIRNNTHCCLYDQSRWQACNTLYARASRRPQRLGRCALTRGRPQDCTLYLYQRERKGRHAYRNGKRCQSHATRKSQKREHEPWLLATSLPDDHCTAKQVVNWYAQRMQIEASFRDTKSQSYGWRLDNARSRSAERIEVLLLIAALAQFSLMLIGYQGEQQRRHYHCQANSIKHRRVLSLVRLGWQLWQRDPRWAAWALRTALRNPAVMTALAM